MTRSEAYSEISSTGMGLYGSPEGIKSFLGEYDKKAKRTAEKADPQKVYDYEFDNHECGYIYNDEPAIKIIIEIFGSEKAKQVKRRNAFFEI